MTRAQFGLVAAAFIAAVDLLALAVELVNSLSHSLAAHRGLAEALYLHFRFFTILTNWGIVLLLATTVVRRLRGRDVPSASWFGGALVFIVVVGATYEILLRKTGMTHNLFFFTDMILHDVVPLFYTAFWLGFAPKHGLSWRDAVRWLAVPAAYFAVTLVAGAYGQGYPYFFLNVREFGWESVMTNAVIFLVTFLVLGLVAVLVSRAVPRGLETSRPLAADTR